MQEIPLNPWYGNQAHFCMATDDDGNIIEIENPYAPGRARVATTDDFYHDYLAFYLESTLKQQIEQGILSPQKTSGKVPSPMGASLLSMCPVRFDTIATSENGIRVDVIVQADIELWTSEGGVFRADTVQQWFRCPFDCDLSIGALSISGLKVTVYRKQDNLKGRRLDKYLIPIIPNSNLDNVAEELLSERYPEALEKPTPVYGDVLAERIGYGIVRASITKDHDLQGQCFFAEDTIGAYNPVTNDKERIQVPAKTILIDQNLDRILEPWGENDVKVHECLHALLDRHFYLLQRLFNDELRCLSSPVQSDYWGDDNKPMRVIEARMAKLTPRVRMPATQTHRKIEELLAQYHVTDRLTISSDAQAHRLKNVVGALAAFYCVSNTTARLRMIELGYNCVKGIMNYYGNSCSPWHNTAPGGLAWNQTVTIGIADAAVAYAEDSSFAALIDCGCFQYVEGHFCLDDPQYVEIDSAGYARLTTYARQHADECCLVFSIKGWSTSWEHTGGALYRESHPEKSKVSLSEDIELTAAERAALIAEARSVHKTALQLPVLFCDTLTHHMRKRGMTVEQLSENCGLSIRTLSILRNDESAGKSVRQLTALCIGLHLEPELSQDLFQKGGQRFVKTEEHAVYSLLLRTMYHSSLFACNAILQDAGIKPLKEA